MDAPFSSNDIVLAKMTKVYNRNIYKSQTIFVSNISLFFLYYKICLLERKYAYFLPDLELVLINLFQTHGASSGHKQSLCEVRTLNVSS